MKQSRKSLNILELRMITIIISKRTNTHFGFYPFNPVGKSIKRDEEGNVYLFGNIHVDPVAYIFSPCKLNRPTWVSHGRLSSDFIENNNTGRNRRHLP
jgi:hypothetical protein